MTIELQYQPHHPPVDKYITDIISTRLCASTESYHSEKKIKASFIESETKCPRGVPLILYSPVLDSV